jgi:phosphate-selective porin
MYVVMRSFDCSHRQLDVATAAPQTTTTITTTTTTTTIQSTKHLNKKLVYK